MYQKVKEYIKAQKMLTSEDRIVTGVSGGADSICLLFVLLELRKEMGFELCVVHVHHGLRGEAADADEAYVESVCREKKIPFYVFHEDVIRYARENHLTEEEAGREVRRIDFLKVYEEWNGTCIALAHHQNDNAETFLWNLCRGSALKGLGGILPKNGKWIRPLLCVSREEIESYLKKREISYCTDETNLFDDYTRNKIRNRVIPYLEDHINKKTVAHIAESMEHLQKIYVYVEREISRYMEQCIKVDDGGILLYEDGFQAVPEELKEGVVYETLCRVTGRKKDIGAVHIKEVGELFEKQTGKKISLPYSVKAVRIYEGIRFEKNLDRRKKVVKESETESFLLSEADKSEGLFQSHVFKKCTESYTIPENTYTKWFDYDIIKNTVKIRHRRAGDYIVIDNAGKKQKLKQYFINEKIPQNIRDHIWLVADGSEILWIVGYRQSQAYQISSKTERILEIEFYGGKENGRDGESFNTRRRSCKESC